MEGGMNCVKYLMFFFNLLIFLAGAVLLGVGIWVTTSADSFKQIVSSDPLIFHLVYIIIAVGGALFLIGFLGCCGAVNENRCLLGTFFALVLILFLIQIVGAVLVIVFAPNAEKAAHQSIVSDDVQKETKEAWDGLQQTFKCCGVDGPLDWKFDIPDSCCPGNSCLGKIPFKNGCKPAMATMFWTIAGIALGVLFIELLAMIFSCCLYCRIGEYKGYA